MAGLFSWLKRFVGSRSFFILILALFIFEATWIALSATYPMVFDENTHFGIIQLYAHQWSPIFTHQPPGTEALGALQHNPSFLYEYLLSFPYRLLAHITTSQAVQIICLRFINIALMGVALVLFWKLLRRLGVGRILTNAILLVFVLIPVVPLLAGQINYDNLVTPAAALAFLLVVEFVDRLRKLEFSPSLLAGLLITCLFGSVVQYEFTPLFVALVLWLIWEVLCILRQRHGRKLWLGVLGSLKHMSLRRWLVLGIPLLVATGLFVETYGVNLVLFHTPSPSCSQILTPEQCAHNATWERNEVGRAHKQTVDPNPVRFAAGWVYRLLVSMYYTSSGGAPKAYYLSIDPLPIMFGTAVVLGAVGVCLSIFYFPVLLRHHRQLCFLVFASTFYAAALFAHNYAAYLDIGQKIGINGRYIFTVLVPYLALFALAYRQLFRNHVQIGASLTVVSVLLLLQGGGALSYIVASNPDWYWQGNSLAPAMNRVAQKIVNPLVLAKEPLHGSSIINTLHRLHLH